MAEDYSQLKGCDDLSVISYHDASRRESSSTSWMDLQHHTVKIACMSRAQTLTVVHHSCAQLLPMLSSSPDVPDPISFLPEPSWPNPQNPCPTPHCIYQLHPSIITDYELSPNSESAVDFKQDWPILTNLSQISTLTASTISAQLCSAVSLQMYGWLCSVDGLIDGL